jgi:hypothetical protein
MAPMIARRLGRRDLKQSFEPVFLGEKLDHAADGFFRPKLDNPGLTHVLCDLAQP